LPAGFPAVDVAGRIAGKLAAKCGEKKHFGVRPSQEGSRIRDEASVFAWLVHGVTAQLQNSVRRSGEHVRTVEKSRGCNIWNACELRLARATLELDQFQKSHYVVRESQ